MLVFLRVCFFFYFSSKEELFKVVVCENLLGCFSEWNVELDVYIGGMFDMLCYVMRMWCSFWN